MSVDNVQSLLTEALFDEAALGPALEALAAECNAPVAQLMVTNAARTLLRSSFGGPLRYDLVAAEPDYQEINPRVAAIPSMRPGHVSLDRDYISNDEIKRDPTYQELIIACDLGHIAAVPLAIDPEYTGGFAIHRRWTDETFSDEEAALIQRTITRVCGPVFSLMRMVQTRDARTVLDVVGPTAPAAAISASGRVLDHNQGFDDLLATGAIRLSRTGQLLLSPDARHRLLHHLNPADGVIDGQFSIRSQADDTVLLARLLPLPHIGVFPPAPAAAILTIDPLDAQWTLDAALATEVYGLTPSELDVATRLCNGESPSQIAHQRGVSEHTVRSLLKNLMTKTETNRQSQLIARLAPLRTTGNRLF